MNLLIVDDEQLEVEAAKASVDYAALGIDLVLEANNIRQAIELFAEQAFHILLCDIEMPQGSGLELLEWVRAHSPQTVCILVTCHADFRYAKQAMRLGSLDYLLKPAQPDELRAVVEKAIQLIKSTAKEQESIELSKLWLQHQPMMVEHFWLDVLTRKTSPSYEVIRAYAQEINVPGLEDIRIFPILVRVRKWNETIRPKDEKLAVFALKNVAQDLILKQPDNGFMVYLGHGGLLILLHTAGDENLGQLESDCEEYISACGRYLMVDLSCYLGHEIRSDGLADMVERLSLLEGDNVSEACQVFRLDDDRPARVIDTSEMYIWTKLLERREEDRLLEEIGRYVRALSDSATLSERDLIHIQRNFMQVMGSFLREAGISAGYLYSDEESVALFSKATRSIGNLLRWMTRDVIKALDYLRESQNNLSAMEKAKHYIAINIERDITCKEIAASVYLNSVYLSRIFKKECGMGLLEYLQREKMNLAKGLLEKTSLPVSIIAAKLGYSNFSYFSKMFKSYTGATPIEFRNNLSASERA